LEAGSVCVIGAGITGMTVAKDLSRAGVRVSLVDRNPYPGGQAIFYGCKAADSCVHCGVCLVRDAVQELRENLLASCYFSASPSFLQRSQNNGYLVELETTPNPIDWHSCTECGECRAVCPHDAVQQIPGWKYFITSNCTSCGDCVGACPVGAIRLNREPETRKIDAQGIVVAAGFHPFDPSVNRKWGCGNSARVVTGSEMERLFSGETYLPKDSRRIAFVQCVGSRDVREGQPHCSRVCCAFALRMANRIATEFPDAHIDVYYMDIQHFGKNFEGFMNDLRGKVSFCRANPICIKTDQEGSPLLRYESLIDLRCRDNPYDLVVLANGMSPPEGGDELAEMFGLDMDSQGYLRSPGRASSTGPDRGIFVAGSCRRPMLIEESVDDASAVSHMVLRHLGVA
jgi:heterodisulfide reductase subunit A2